MYASQRFPLEKCSVSRGIWWRRRMRLAPQKACPPSVLPLENSDSIPCFCTFCTWGALPSGLPSCCARQSVTHSHCRVEFCLNIPQLVRSVARGCDGVVNVSCAPVDVSILVFGKHTCAIQAAYVWLQGMLWLRRGCSHHGVVVGGGVEAKLLVLSP